MRGPNVCPPRRIGGDVLPVAVNDVLTGRPGQQARGGLD
jgi:hypothetical protein